MSDRVLAGEWQSLPTRPVVFRNARCSVHNDSALPSAFEVDASPYTALSIRLSGADIADLDGFPGIAALTPRLLRETLLLVPDCRYRWRLELRVHGETYRSDGSVIVDLVPAADPPGPGRRVREQTREVDDALQRGLLDGWGHAYANFRLGVKPALAHHRAMLDSAHIPADAWRVDVLFCRFYNMTRQTWVRSPESGELIEFRFVPGDGRRDFRLTDLFPEA